MRIQDFLVSDEVRFESNGKLIFIGVYLDAIELQVPADVLWPQNLPRLALFMRVLIEPKDERPDAYSLVVLENGTPVARHENSLQLASGAIHFPVLAAFAPFPIIGPGTLTCALEARRDGNPIATLEPRMTTAIRVTAAKT